MPERSTVTTNARAPDGQFVLHARAIIRGVKGPWRGERFALRTGARCGPTYGNSNSPCCLEMLDDALGEFLGSRGHGGEHKLSRLRRLVR